MVQRQIEFLRPGKQFHRALAKGKVSVVFGVDRIDSLRQAEMKCSGGIGGRAETYSPDGERNAHLGDSGVVLIRYASGDGALRGEQRNRDQNERDLQPANQVAPEGQQELYTHSRSAAQPPEAIIRIRRRSHARLV